MTADNKWNTPRSWIREQRQKQTQVETVKVEAVTEVDLEHLDVFAIERFEGQTFFRVHGHSPMGVTCSLQEHNAYIARYRAKLGLQ